MEYHLPLLAMSEEQLKAFLAALEADTGLQAKLKAAVEGEIDTPDETAAVLAIAKEAGFAITAADLLRFEAQNILELSDEELEGVAGGVDFWKVTEDVIVKNDKLYKKLNFAYKLFNGKLF